MCTKTAIIILSFAALSLAGNPFLSIPMDDGDILKPLLHLGSSQEVEEAYRVMFRKYYRYEIKATGKPHLILAEIAQLSAADIYTGFKYDDQEYLKGVVKNIFITHKHKLDDLESISKSFTELTIDYTARSLQISLDKMDQPEAPEADTERGSVDAEVIEAAFAEFVSEQKLSLTPQQHDKVLNAARDAFRQAIQTAQSINYSILNFHLKGRDFALLTGKKLLDFVFALKTLPSLEENKLMARKIMSLVKLVAQVSTPEDDFLFMQSIGKVLTQDHLPWLITNKQFVDIMVGKILKAFAASPRVDHMRFGKEIFVSYFALLKDYPQPTEAYKQFIIRKYRKSGLKFQIQNLSAEYDRMLRIYAIDVVHTSIFLDFELLEPADIKMLFLGFARLAENYSVQEQTLFVRLRQMMLGAGEAINRLPLLFESLYDSLLHCSQYYTHGYKGEFTNPETYASLYDNYVDFMWSWKNSLLLGLFWKWEPNPAFFPINIEENYAFFKLINLTTNAAALGSLRVSFHSFLYQNNYWIHKYTTEPAPRRLLNFLRNRYFAGKSFNYGNLRGLALAADAMPKFARYISSAEDL